MLNNSTTNSTPASFVQKSQRDDISDSSFKASSVVTSTVSFIDDKIESSPNNDTAVIMTVDPCNQKDEILDETKVRGSLPKKTRKRGR